MEKFISVSGSGAGSHQRCHQKGEEKRKTGNDPNTRRSFGLKGISIAQEEALMEARLKNAAMGPKQGESENIGGKRINLVYVKTKEKKGWGEKGAKRVT